MTWNYRVIKHIDRENRESFRIHEVYYAEDQVVTVSEGPAIPSGESRADLEEDIRLMLEAFGKSVINYADI